MSYLDHISEVETAKFLDEQFGGLTTEVTRLSVSEWAAKNRYLPAGSSPRVGYWDNEWNPHMVEPMDCLSEDSPIQSLTLMKCAQIGATTMVENWVGYTVGESPAPMIYLTADKELAEQAIALRIMPMLDHCGLSGNIKPASTASRRTGDTKALKEFPGGFLLGLGPNSPGKLRSRSAQRALVDEVDGIVATVGDEGDPVALAINRTNAFSQSRKIFYTSTPLIMQTSRIYRLYKAGDQRQRFVPCPHCGEYQILVTMGRTEDGKTYGLDFEVDDKGRLITETVGYVCRECGVTMYERHKSEMFSAGEWRPSATAEEEFTRSYHLNVLYSPPGMYSWARVAADFVQVYDIRTKRVKDAAAYQVFVNTKQGLPWEERGAAPSYEKVISHRRSYKSNEIPNKQAVQEGGHPVRLLTAAVDVHKTRLDVEIVGWCPEGRSYSVAWRHLECEDVTDIQGPHWAKLRDIIENEEWTADDGKVYGVVLTIIDAGYETDTVRAFCEEYHQGVIPVFGRDSLRSAARLRNFYFHEKTFAADVNVDFYKGRLASWLRRDWNQGELQPVGYANYPEDYGDDFFREYTAESKVKKVHPKTGQVLGYYWVKEPNKPNHAWDCRVYGMAALDMYILEICQGLTGEEWIDYAVFWKWCEEQWA